MVDCWIRDRDGDEKASGGMSEERPRVIEVRDEGIEMSELRMVCWDWDRDWSCD